MGHILHLRNQVRLRDENARDGILCILCEVSPIRAEAIVERALAIASADKNRGLKFGLSSPDQEWFTKAGDPYYTDDHLGLTCSHFVLALFRDVGLPLVQFHTWPVRAEDVQWQEQLFRTAYDWEEEHDKAGLARLDGLKNGIGNKRVRPLEVAGAALAEGAALPVSFDRAVELGRAVEAVLNSRFPPAFQILAMKASRWFHGLRSLFGLS